MDKDHSTRNLIISIAIYLLLSVLVILLGDWGVSKAGRYTVMLAIGAVLITVQYYFVRKNRARGKDQNGKDSLEA
jgi:L-asparagine transporter-like permease